MQTEPGPWRPERGAPDLAPRPAPAAIPYPFTAIVGQDALKTALLCAAVNPALGGALILGQRGTGKSTIVRALGGLLPPIPAVAGCRYGCDPAGPLCDECRSDPARLRGRVVRPVPVVDLPLGATPDRLTGSLDLEQALGHGVRAYEPGLLARANRGFLYIDEVNLLEDYLVDLLLDVAASGVNVVEREGLSVRHPARFVLVGSANPEEGELRPQLLDRFGLLAEVETIADLDARVEIVRRREAFEQDPGAFARRFAPAQRALARQVRLAQRALGKTRFSDPLLRDTAALCRDLRVDGHRGELTIVRAARALAALGGRPEATAVDVRQVALPALRHRLRRAPLDPPDGAARVAEVLDHLFPPMIPAPALETALAVLAVAPRLGGLLVRGADGWALEPAARLLAQVLGPAAGPPAPLLRLPVNPALDHLLGGLDLPASLAAGRRVLRPGLLAAHDGGVLWLPDPDLLEPAVAGPLARALHTGLVRVEREGVSAAHPARLLLLTVAPDESASRYPALAGRAGLWLAAAEPPAATPAVAPDAGAIRAARALCPAVRGTDAQVATLAAVALRLGVPGLRPDALALYAARASAALAGRRDLADDDLAVAVALVLAPRATRAPAPQDAPPPPPPAPRDPAPPAAQPAGGEEAAPAASSPPAPPERLIAAQAAYLPPAVLTPPPGRPGRAGPPALGAGRRAGEHRLLPAAHGRPGPPRPAAPRPPGATLDLAATLTTAARRHAAAGTLPPRGAGGSPRLRIRPEDLQWRRPQAPPGVLFLIAVDASGSMARHRLGPAKGAVLLLLERAYQHRDRVALLAIRGPQAQVLLPPTRSLARARHLLAALPAGGGTPLASALALSASLAAQAARTGSPRTLLVLLTDGRANLGLAGPAPPAAIQAEVHALAARWAAGAAGGAAASLVVDTRLRFLGGGEAAALAAALGGRYLYLPHAGPATLGDAAEQAVAALGWRGP